MVQMMRNTEIIEGEARASLVVVTSGWSCGVASNRSTPRGSKGRIQHELTTRVQGCHIWGTTTLWYPSVVINTSP